jgi:hypothetical protein
LTPGPDVTIATAGIVERRNAGDTAKERARLRGEWVEEEVVDGCDDELRFVLEEVDLRLWGRYT